MLGDISITTVARMLNRAGTEVTAIMTGTTAVGDGMKIVEIVMMIIHPDISTDPMRNRVIMEAIRGGPHGYLVKGKWGETPSPLVVQVVMSAPKDYFFCQCSTIRCSSPPGAQITKAWTGFLEMTL